MKTSTSIDILMPQLGQAMVSGVVVQWHAGEGDEVLAGAPLLTIESDKSAFEIDAPATGRLSRFAGEGEEAEVGAVLGTIGDASPAPPGAAGMPDTDPEPRLAPPVTSDRDGKVRASPRARAAAQGKVDLAEVVPSRFDGMITLEDVERTLLEGTQPGEANAPKGGRQALPSAYKTAIGRLSESWRQAPHIVQMIEVDADRLVQALSLIRSGALPGTLNDIVIKAAADTMADFPDINAHLVGEELVPSDTVDVSIAVATDRGLRTPMLRDVAHLPLERVAELARQAIDAARRGSATTGRASLTISNLGRHGVRFGTPVLNLDEPVLVFVGAIAEKPKVAAGAVVAGHELVLSIAFDHRIVDGLRAAEFSGALRRRLEQLDLPNPGPATAPPAAGRKVSLSSEGFSCAATDGRGHRWIIDEAEAVGGRDRGPDPVSSMLGALLSCLTISFRAAAARRRIPIDRLDGTIETPGDGKVEKILVRLEIESGAEPDKVMALLKPARHSCHVHAMLRPEISINVVVDVRPTVPRIGQSADA